MEKSCPMTIKPQRIFVTGSGGFIGKSVVHRAVAAGLEVFGLDQVPADDVLMRQLAGYFQLRLPSANISNLMRELRPEIVIHCAGSSSVPQSVNEPETDFEAAVPTTFSLLDTLRKNSPESRFLLLSSAAVYGNPTSLPVRETAPIAPISPYGYHKFMAEQCCLEYAKVYGLHTAIARVFSAYGPGLKRQVVWDICRKTMMEPELTLQGTGEETRDFIFSDDLADALLSTARRFQQSGSIYNIASGEEISIRLIAENCLHLLDSKKKVHFTGRLPQGVPSHWRADITSLMSLGFKPSVKFLEGLERFVTWFKTMECQL